MRGLRQLVALADAGTFRGAAERLGVTHSALSQSIAKLETAYGVDLFARTGRETVPTAFGQRLVDAARQAVEVIDNADREIDLMRNLAAGRLVVGADPSVSASLLAPAMTSLLNDYPHLRFTVVSASGSMASDDLKGGRFDLFVGLRPDRVSSEIETLELELPPPVVACRAGHELAGAVGVGIDDLMRFPVIGGEVPEWFLIAIQQAFPDTFPDLDAVRSIFLTAHDFGMIRKMLPVTDAVAMVPLDLVSDDIEAGMTSLMTLEWSPFDGALPGTIAWLGGRPLPPAAQALSDRIERLLERSTAS